MSELYTSAMSSKRKIELDDGDVLEVMPLGAGNEVGRSCIMVRYKGKSVLLDCGIHPAYSGLASLPFFDEIDPSTVDLMLVSHFHLDHCAALPYFTEKTNFKGRVFMTHPTKAIYKLLLSDFVKVSNIAVDDQLYSEKDLTASMERIETVTYHQEVEHNGIKFSCYNAGHVLGAAMFMIEIAGVKVLYTGDFSRQEDRHLMAAEVPRHQPDVLIVESTYGVQVHEPREEREKRFTGIIHDTMKRRGRCLIPVFALGRAQELLLIMDEYWKKNPELHRFPIYYASTLAKKCMAVYQTYINMMNDHIRTQFEISNPFVFKHIDNLKNLDNFDDSESCVVMASPGMLQSGLSRELFERWCSDRRNSLIMPGYTVEGTLAKQVMAEPNEVQAANGQKLALRMSIHYISFSAHSDFKQTSGFIEETKPKHVVLIHGEQNEMLRLKAALAQRFEDENVDFSAPKNTEAASFELRGEKIARVVGQLAKTRPGHGEELKGILVKKNFNYMLVEPTELSAFTQLTTNQIMQKQYVPFRQEFRVLKWHLNQMYEPVADEKRDDKRPCVKIYDAVKIIHAADDHIIVEWSSDPVNDMVADSIVAVIMQVEASPSTVKIMHNPEEEYKELEAQNLVKIIQFLENHFSQVTILKDKGLISLNVGDCPVTIDNGTKAVNAKDPEVQKTIENALKSIESAVYPVVVEE